MQPAVRKRSLADFNRRDVGTRRSAQKVPKVRSEEAAAERCHWHRDLLERFGPVFDKPTFRERARIGSVPHARFQQVRRIVFLLAVAACAIGQTDPDSRVSLYGYSEDANRIRFTVQNHNNVPITFYQVRHQAQCSNGTVVEAGGWGFDSTRTRAGQPDLKKFAPLQIETIDPGEIHKFEFIRPVEVSVVSVSGRSTNTDTCQPSTLKDFTAVFSDGTAVGVREVIEKQFATWRAQHKELKRWLSGQELPPSQDQRSAIKDLRDRLNEEYDDCEDRALPETKIARCQINREIWHQVNEVWQQMRSSPGAAVDFVPHLTSYWGRVADLLEKQLSQPELTVRCPELDHRRTRYFR